MYILCVDQAVVLTTSAEDSAPLRGYLTGYLENALFAHL